MARALDHFVLGVADLDAAAARFAAIGFMVGVRNKHPWGTENRIIQFADQTFFELITVGDASAIPPHAPRHFSFGAFVRDALMKKTGLSMLVLKSTDAKADAAEFARLGIGNFEPFDFARKGKRADGTEVEVAFSLAFAAEPAMPDCAFFVCQQHFPQNFWSDLAQQHTNGAQGIRRVTLVAENPSDHHIFLAGFVGERAMRSTSFGIEIAAGQGIIEIVSPEGFEFRYGTRAPAAPSPTFAGLEITTAKLEGMHVKGFEKHAGGLTAPADHDFATALRFVPVGRVAV